MTPQTTPTAPTPMPLAAAPRPVPMPTAMPAPQLMPAPQAMLSTQAMPSPQAMSRAVPVAHPAPTQLPPMPQAAPQATPQAVPQPGMQPQFQPQPQPGAPVGAPLGMANAASQPQMQPQMQPVMQPPVQAVPQHGGAAPGALHGAPLGMPMPETSVSVLPIDEPAHEGGETALPAITIHAFCDRQDTAGVVNESTRDWRMKRTNVKIFMGGLTAAIEFYRKESTPALIMIETGMRGGELFAQLGELASVCEPTTKVVVVGAANDIRLYRQLMDEGVSDYLVPPFHPIGLIRSLSALYSDPDAPFTGRVCAFFGAKGGVGSSTIAHNVAWQLAETLHQDTALVDLDTSWGTTGLDFKYDLNSGLEEALSDPSRLDDTLLDRIMLRHTPRLSILPASGGLGRGVMDTEAFEAVVGAVRSVSPLAILDLPHLWSDWTESVLTAADDIVITASLDLANLRNTKNLVDFLRAKRPNDPDPILVVNNAGLSDMSLADFGSMVGMEPSVVFDHDPKVFVAATNSSEMITDTKTAPGTVEGLQRIATRIKTGQFPAVGGGSGSRKLSIGRGKKADKTDTPEAAPADAKATESKSFILKMLKRG